MKKLINKLTVAVLATITSTAFAGREGNGGDSVAISFQKSALEFIKDVRGNPGKFPKLNAVNLEKLLNEADFMVVDQPQPVKKYNLIQNAGVTNHKKADAGNDLENDLIVIHRAGWIAKDNNDPIVRKALACHELVSLENMEETGVYRICQGYIASMLGMTPVTAAAKDQFEESNDQLTNERTAVYQDMENSVSKAIVSLVKARIDAELHESYGHNGVQFLESQIQIKQSVLRNPVDLAQLQEKQISKLKPGQKAMPGDFGKVLMSGVVLLKTKYHTDFFDSTNNSIYKIPFILAMQKDINIKNLAPYPDRYEMAILGVIHQMNSDTKDKYNGGEFTIDANMIARFMNMTDVYKHGPINYAAMDASFLTLDIERALQNKNSISYLKGLAHQTSLRTSALQAAIDLETKLSRKSDKSAKNGDDDDDLTDERRKQNAAAEIAGHTAEKRATWKNFTDLLGVFDSIYINSEDDPKKDVAKFPKSQLNRPASEALMKFATINGLNLENSFQRFDIYDFPNMYDMPMGLRAAFPPTEVMKLAQFEIHDPKKGGCHIHMKLGSVNGEAAVIVAGYCGDESVFRPAYAPVGEMHNHGGSIDVYEANCGRYARWVKGASAYCTVEGIEGRNY